MPDPIQPRVPKPGDDDFKYPATHPEKNPFGDITMPVVKPAIKFPDPSGAIPSKHIRERDAAIKQAVAPLEPFSKADEPPLIANPSKERAVQDSKEEYAERIFSKGLEAARRTIDRAFHTLGETMFVPIPKGMEGKSELEIIAYKKGCHDIINGLCVHLYVLYADCIKFENSADFAKTGKVELTVVHLDAKFLEGWTEHKDLVGDVLFQFYKDNMHKQGTPEYEKGRNDTWSTVSENINKILMRKFGQISQDGFRTISL